METQQSGESCVGPLMALMEKQMEKAYRSGYNVGFADAKEGADATTVDITVKEFMQGVGSVSVAGSRSAIGILTQRRSS